MERPLFRTLYGKRSAEKTARLSTLNSLGQLMPIGVGRNTSADNTTSISFTTRVKYSGGKFRLLGDGAAS